MILTLTRAEFDNACREYIREQREIISELRWIWNEHNAYPLGFLSRRVSYPLNQTTSAMEQADTDAELEDSGVDDMDEHAASGQPDTMAFCDQYVCYSATFQVPIFYFNLFELDGTPLPLARILSTTLLKGANLPLAHVSSYSMTPPDAPFPLLSQGDHPTLGTPCWYFHPCETSAAVVELLKERGNDAHDAITWLRAWFAVLSTVVDTR